MQNTYSQLIHQSFEFPQNGFELKNNELTFHGIPLMQLIKKYGTPFKLMYLPKIFQQINKARTLFNNAIKKENYLGNYHYCYCTKSNHFSHVIEAALQENVHLETSAAFDIDLIFNLLENGKIDRERTIINNGYKSDNYLKKIVELYEHGFQNVIVVLDNVNELDRLLHFSGGVKIKIGVRMAVNEEPQSAYNTSRFGIQPTEILSFYNDVIEHTAQVELVMLHFFVDSGIKDNLHYWGEFQKASSLYASLKKRCPSLACFNLGGGFPIQNNLGFDYDYQYMADEIVKSLKLSCDNENIEMPDIYTEFGRFSVGESGATIFKVNEEKKQNDTEKWYLIDNSLMNTIPDAWSIHEKFILLPINKWNHPYEQVNIGGISCDHSDYYNTEDFNQQIYLPIQSNPKNNPLYLGFFHTGAYQDAISGYGGIKHCLIPAPKHVIVSINEFGELHDYVYRNEQSAQDMFELLGYNKSCEILQE